ncbi:heme-binding protein [Roseateles sp. P5_E7]
MKCFKFPMALLTLACSHHLSAQEITLQHALEMARSVLSACENRGVRPSLSVVDSKGVTKVVVRADGASRSPVAAPRKAATAAFHDLPGSVMEPRVLSDPAFKAAIESAPERWNAHAGSMPLHYAGKVVGGIAVADVPHDVADACLRAGLAATTHTNVFSSYGDLAAEAIAAAN